MAFLLLSLFTWFAAFYYYRFVHVASEDIGSGGCPLPHLHCSAGCRASRLSCSLLLLLHCLFYYSVLGMNFLCASHTPPSLSPADICLMEVDNHEIRRTLSHSELVAQLQTTGFLRAETVEPVPDPAPGRAVCLTFGPRDGDGLVVRVGVGKCVSLTRLLWSCK